eukprot:3137600-Rhodomonas_salina.1
MDACDGTGPTWELLQNLSATVGTEEVIQVQLGLPVPCSAWSHVLSPAVNLESAVLLTDTANLPPGRAGVNPDRHPGTVWHMSRVNQVPPPVQCLRDADSKHHGCYVSAD